MATSEYLKEYRKRNPEKIRAINNKSDLKRRLADTNNAKERMQKWRAAHPENARIALLKHKYNITPKDYVEMLKQQNNKCLICNIDFVLVRQPHINHDHKTNKVRGILCPQCNMALGLLDDNVEYLEAALNYIKNQ